jgi:hypothetical protein
MRVILSAIVSSFQGGNALAVGSGSSREQTGAGATARPACQGHRRRETALAPATTGGLPDRQHREKTPCKLPAFTKA